MYLGIYNRRQRSKWWKVQWHTDKNSRISQIMRRNYYSHYYNMYRLSSEWTTLHYWT